MLVIISDLHLQHIALDVLRYSVGDEVRETGVRRNVTAGALQLLFSEILENTARRGARTVELVLAGDILELLRTPLWFSGGDIEVRPTLPWRPGEAAGALGPDDDGNPLRERVHRILDGIENDNEQFFAVLERFVTRRAWTAHGAEQSLGDGVEVVAHYLPGNHDRLANGWPSVRRRVRGLLAMAPSEEPFPHTIDRPKASGYGVRIRHGHEYDRSNLAADVAGGAGLHATEEEYLLPCLGDYVTLDVVGRISAAFRARYAASLRAPGADGEHIRSLYTALTEFDDVRPAALLASYLANRFGRGANSFELLRPVLRDVYQAAAFDPFLRGELRRLDAEQLISPFNRGVIGVALRDLSAETLEKQVPRLLALDTSSGSPAETARFEEGLADGSIDLVIAGHTHSPDQVPLPGAAGRRGEPFFIDSGTWRSQVRSGVGGAFAHIRSYTMVLCFHETERRETDDHRRFETWTGHLAAGEADAVDARAGYFGPYDEPRGTLAPARQRLRFLSCHVQRIDEGGSSGGAELRLRCGVDGAALHFDHDGVRDDQRLELDRAVDLHPELDGELWAWGFEEDGGGLFIDPDDPLPWAVRYLPRDGAGFAIGKGELYLRARGDGSLGASLVLAYEVFAIES
ncbi:MAG: hypothetical protein EXR72_11505 [Myxococcales bacterium]|nr:hypothetical protein [Myxococcales bacterium]